MIVLKKALSMVLVTVLLTGVLAGCGGGSESAKGTDVIKVNDTTLDSNYVDTRIEQIFKQNQLESDDAYSGYYKSQIISGLVETELMVQEAKKRGIEVSDEDKENYKKDLIETSYGSEDNFKAYLEEYNISDDILDRMLEEKLYYDKLVENLKSEITVDAQAYYDENKDSFNVGDQVRASHILVKDEDTAKKIIAKLDKGEDFAKLAEEYSTDTASKAQGGDLGFFTAEEMVTEFSDAAFALEKGKYTTEPVKTSYGYHVILCTDKKAAHQQTFDEVKDELTETLENQEVQTKYTELMTSLREKATIEYLSDDYNPEKLAEKAQEEIAKEAEKSESSATAESSATEETTDAAVESSAAEEQAE